MRYLVLIFGVVTLVVCNIYQLTTIYDQKKTIEELGFKIKANEEIIQHNEDERLFRMSDQQMREKRMEHSKAMNP